MIVLTPFIGRWCVGAGDGNARSAALLVVLPIDVEGLPHEGAEVGPALVAVG